MRHRAVWVLLCAWGASAPLALAWWSTRPLAAEHAALVTMPAGGGTEALPDRSVTDSLLMATVARAPFRATRRPPSRAYDPEALAAASAPLATAPPKPTLVLTGLILGPEPAAIIEGIPGREGSAVIREGAQEGGIRVRRIRAGDVVLVGLDTSWTLKVRNPW
jgi:hypothetical protein